MERIDGMFISIFTLNVDGKSSDDLDKLFESMLNELQSITTPSVEMPCLMYQSLIFFHYRDGQGVYARNMMRSTVDMVLALH